LILKNDKECQAHPPPAAARRTPLGYPGGCRQSVGALRGVQPRCSTVGVECSSPRPGVDRGRQGSLLEDDAAVQLGRALVSRTLWAAKLVASDGRMNVTNERPSVESDEETFMDQHGRSLHLVGRMCCMNGSHRRVAGPWSSSRDERQPFYAPNHTAAPRPRQASPRRR
jgi:hypothetical protein